MEGFPITIQPQELVILFDSKLNPAGERLGGGRLGPMLFFALTSAMRWPCMELMQN